ncbi:MAG: hypothetical protein EBQ77_00070 [Sphingobacteriia bacterium]|nr:hypothetical protein [Sphingobacteriia bacterium]
MQNLISPIDFLLAPIYLIIFSFIATRFKNKNLKAGPYYRFYLQGLWAKMLGGLAVCLIYAYYYKGGDTLNYFIEARTYVNVFLEGDYNMLWELINFKTYPISSVNYGSYENCEFIFRDESYYEHFTSAITTPLCLLGFKSFFTTTLILAYLSYFGIWRLYIVYVYYFPNQYRPFAWAILLVPSVFFWGSGLLKDTYTFSALCWYIYAFFRLFIQKQYRFKYVLALLVAAYIMISIKPYILFAALPGSILWLFFNRLNNIQNIALRLLSFPAIIIIVFTLVIGSMALLGDYLGEYALSQVLYKAEKTQKDFAYNEAYGGNKIDIGEFDASLSGIIQKAPKAISVGLFQPFIWKANNIVMAFAGLENLFILALSLYVLFKVKHLVLSLFSHPLFIFSFLFALFFAFSVGLTTANYGALVRLRIPCMPFYLCSLIMLLQLKTKQ